MVKCMMFGTTYDTGKSDELQGEDERNMRALARDTVFLEDAFDHLGRPGVKIVYVDTGSYFNKIATANQHIQTIHWAEKKKEIMDGIPVPRLIFFKQDKDYWPGSENDPDVMARRVAKEEAFKGYGMRPNFSEIYLPFSAKDGACETRLEWRTDFLRYFDPSLPGTKFIIDNMDPTRRRVFEEALKENPDIREMLSSLLDGASSSN